MDVAKDAIVLATTNTGKIREIEALMPQFKFLPRPAEVPDVEETASTFLGNARLKAQALVKATGRPALADDSGLEVDAIDGAPGVRSARFAGESATDAQNIAKLLDALTGIPAEKRTARFRTTVVLLFPDGREVVADGIVEGRIVEEARGENGFGYDPVFMASVTGDRTFGQISSTEKNAISHRGAALRNLASVINP